MTDNAALLQSIQSINDMVGSVNNSCVGDCLINKNQSELRQRYLDAQRNVRVAPEKLTQAEHDYLLNRDGRKKYGEKLRSRYSKNAEQEMKKLKDEHATIMNEVKQNLMKIKSQEVEIYNSTNYKNMLISTNTQVEGEFQDNKQSTMVSSRKIFYMEKQIESFSWGFYLCGNLYWVCALVWVIIGVIYYRQFTTRSLGIFVFIVAYPFFMVWLFVAAYSSVKYVVSMFPRDVYLSI